MKINQITREKLSPQVWRSLGKPHHKKLVLEQPMISKHFFVLAIQDWFTQISGCVTGFPGTASFPAMKNMSRWMIELAGQWAVANSQGHGRWPGICDGVFGERIISKCVFRLPIDFGNQSPCYDVGQLKLATNQADDVFASQYWKPLTVSHNFESHIFWTKVPIIK